MRYITFADRLTIGEMNKRVKASGIRCQALGCTKPATRYSHLCDWCEIRWLQHHVPVFGSPSPKEIATAKRVITDYFCADLEDGRFKSWVKQIAKTLEASVHLLQRDPYYLNSGSPKEKVRVLLAHRLHKISGPLTHGQALGLIAFTLAMDALYTPLIPPVVRNQYALHFVGHRFMGVRTIFRDHVRLMPDGSEKNERHRYVLRRAELKRIGNLLWQGFRQWLIIGGRKGNEWRELRDRFLVTLHTGS
jgi:hypothetical protein